MLDLSLDRVFERVVEYTKGSALHDEILIASAPTLQPSRRISCLAVVNEKYTSVACKQKQYLNQFLPQRR